MPPQIASQTDPSNLGFVECWNQILTPKWIRFRHLLSGNGKVHSDLAADFFAVAEGERVLDVGCGFGETCLEMSEAVGVAGRVHGIDCTESFLRVAEEERAAAGAENVSYELVDAQSRTFEPSSYDVAYSRFGVMFFASAVAAMRNMHAGLEPGGRMCLLVWRGSSENEWVAAAKEATLRHLPPPGDDGKTCGPGPFSMADEETDRLMIRAAGFPDAEFRRQDAPICVGRDLAEALEYQLAVGPAGEIVREAGELGREKLPEIRDELIRMLRANQRDDGSVWLDSSTWAIVARKPL